MDADRHMSYIDSTIWHGTKTEAAAIAAGWHAQSLLFNTPETVACVKWNGKAGLSWNFYILVITITKY